MALGTVDFVFFNGLELTCARVHARRHTCALKLVFMKLDEGGFVEGTQTAIAVVTVRV